MNYRHIFHAGNICDVVKHATLAFLIEHLGTKDKGFFVLDTHAGIGLYDLRDPRALKTNEAIDGILKLIMAPPLLELAGYYKVLQKLNPDWSPAEVETAPLFRHYPGSPLLTYHLLRPQDRLVACELHPEDAHTLKYQFHDHKQAHIHLRDGYEALRAFLPPEEKRGLVLIDPPFEKVDEFKRLVQDIESAYRRWPQGQFMIWYPIKERPAIWSFHDSLIRTRIPKILCAEFIFNEETRSDRLNGSGLILINPPWQSDEKLGIIYKKLHQALQTKQQQNVIKWLLK